MIGQRLQLRLGAEDAVVTRYEAVRAALLDAGEIAPDAEQQAHENAVERVKTTRETFLAAAQAKLYEPISDKEPK